MDINWILLTWWILWGHRNTSSSGAIFEFKEVFWKLLERFKKGGMFCSIRLIIICKEGNCIRKRDTRRIMLNNAMFAQMSIKDMNLLGRED